MENEEESTHRKINTGTGLALVGVGVVGVLWIAERLFSLGDGPQAIPLVGKFLAFDAAARTIVTPSGKYEVPEGAYFAAGIFLYILMLGVGVSLISWIFAAFFSAAALAQPADALRNEAAAQYRRILAGFSARGKLDDDAALLGRTRRISAGLIIAAADVRAETAAWSWEVHMTSDASTGAFCMAGGKVLVGGELVKRLGLSDGELAMLLGHEIAHAVAGHRREIPRMEMESDPAEDIRQIEIALMQEREADEIGMRLAYRAGWPASSLASFYEKLAAQEIPGTFNSSHPSAASRVTWARAMARELDQQGR